MRSLFLIFAALAFFTTTLPAQADMPRENLVGFSETDKAGFAFYHLINKEPPYMDWIQNRPDYMKGSPKDRMLIMDQERVHLRDGFANYQTDRETLLVTAPLNFTVIDNPDYPADKEAHDKVLTKRVLITMPGDKPPYFPFQVGKFWVGVIPNDLEKSLSIDMSEEDWQTLSKGLKLTENFKNKSIPVSIVLQPVQADAKTPVVEGGMPVFLMLSNIASLTMRSPENELLWGWTSPWFLNSQSNELMTLHK